jgi:hypothetical protein
MMGWDGTRSMMWSYSRPATTTAAGGPFGYNRAVVIHFLIIRRRLSCGINMVHVEGNSSVICLLPIVYVTVTSKAKKNPRDIRHVNPNEQQWMIIIHGMMMMMVHMEGK